jgi:hypothetical protein
LGYATRRQQESLRELQSSDVGARFVQEAPLIMVAEKRDEHLRARIQMIACQRHRHLAQRFALGESAMQRTEYREIEQGIHPSINVVEARTSPLEKGDECRIIVGHFSDDVHLGYSRLIAAVQSRQNGHGT